MTSDSELRLFGLRLLWVCINQGPCNLLSFVDRCFENSNWCFRSFDLYYIYWRRNRFCSHYHWFASHIQSWPYSSLIIWGQLTDIYWSAVIAWHTWTSCTLWLPTIVLGISSEGGKTSSLTVSIRLRCAALPLWKSGILFMTVDCAASGIQPIELWSNLITGTRKI